MSERATLSIHGMDRSTGDNLDKTTISVGGMTCAACIRRVESALTTVDGVSNAAVNLATGKATIIHRPEWAGVDELKKVISETGYEFLLSLIHI